MQKILITFIVVLLVVGAALGVAIAFILHPSSSAPATGSNDMTTTESSSGGNSVSGSSANQNPSGASGTQAAQTTTSASGDFLKASDTSADPNNSGQYFLAGTAQTPTSTKPYSILYVASDQSFTIALLEEPISDTRVAAEQALEKTLGISEAQMCSLNYNVLVPHEVNQFYSGKNLGFSFCPGATPLQ